TQYSQGTPYGHHQHNNPPYSPKPTPSLRRHHQKRTMDNSRNAQLLRTLRQIPHTRLQLHTLRNVDSMKIGSLFSGYGGLDLAVETYFNAETVWVAEWEDAPSKVLAHHWPEVPNFRDVTQVNW